MRKIVQIHSVATNSHEGIITSVICNDGTAWIRTSSQAFWQRYEDIPQDGYVEEKIDPYSIKNAVGKSNDKFMQVIFDDLHK